MFRGIESCMLVIASVPSTTAGMKRVRNTCSRHTALRACAANSCMVWVCRPPALVNRLLLISIPCFMRLCCGNLRQGRNSPEEVTGNAACMVQVPYIQSAIDQGGVELVEGVRNDGAAACNHLHRHIRLIAVGSVQQCSSGARHFLHSSPTHLHHM